MKENVTYYRKVSPNHSLIEDGLVGYEKSGIKGILKRTSSYAYYNVSSSDVDNIFDVEFKSLPFANSPELKYKWMYSTYKKEVHIITKYIKRHRENKKVGNYAGIPDSWDTINSGIISNCIIYDTP